MIRKATRRKGTTAVETAVVGIVFFMLMFSIFKYARFIFTQQIIFQAAREGARYAVVNSQDATAVSDTQALVKTKMCGLNNNTTYYNCSVFMSDSSGNSTGSGDPADAEFGTYICVQVDYDYSPIVPNLLFLSSKFRLTTKELMYSEAN